jgi:hypothetical protein
MRAHASQRQTGHSPVQRGASTLLLVTMLVTLATLAIATGTRSLWLERLSTDNRVQALQARMAAETGMARVAAQLQAAVQADGLAAFWSLAMADACGPDRAMPGWECRRWVWAAEPGGWTIEGRALRHVTRSPHVVEVEGVARHGAASARVGHSLYQPALLPLPDASVPTRSASDCNLPAWQGALGAQSEAALRLASDSQARAGLHPGSSPARTVYWVDSPADWHQSLGTPDSPVLLVFSRQACTVRCPRIGSAVEIHGTVVLDAGCDAGRLKQWTSGTLHGQLLAPAALLDLAEGSLIVPTLVADQALRLPWPQGMDARHVQWLGGSWYTGAP